MSVQSGSFSFNIGRDISGVLQAPDGTTADLDNITMFEGKQEQTDINIRRLDGRPMFASLPDGWGGSIEIARKNSDIDRIFSEIENQWLDQGNYVTCDIYAVINESDGAQSKWHFTQCAIKFDDAGSWKGDAEVRQKISFKATRRVASNA